MYMILLCKKIFRVQLEVFRDAVEAVGIHGRNPVFIQFSGKDPNARK